MENEYLERVRPGSRKFEQVEALLRENGLRLDPCLDTTLGLFDGTEALLATGSLWKNTLRCLAVRRDRQGEGLMARVVTELLRRTLEAGHSQAFAYAKAQAAGQLTDLGFGEIARWAGRLVFLEMPRGGFAGYLSALPRGEAAAIVMNANPFTLGHRALAERAAAENGRVRVFVVSEDASRFSFCDRLAMVKAGCRDLPGVTVHPTGPYMVSAATFPSYFVKTDEEATLAHARMDAAVFARIAQALGVVRRYLGEEPFSPSTRLYNQALSEALPPEGVAVTIIPRRKAGEEAVSASRVRALLDEGRLAEIRPLVPESTWAYLNEHEGWRRSQ